jgi:hypothetical protein
MKHREHMTFQIKKIGNGWILNMLNYGKSVRKETYEASGEELYFDSLDAIVKWIDEVHNEE